MKKIMTVLTLVGLIATLQLFAQPQGRPGGPPQDGVKKQTNTDGPSQDRDEKLTDTQIEQIKTILADYDADSITAEDAIAIHESFQKEGLRGGKAIDEVIEEAGFDAKKLRELAPPPERKDRPNNAPKE
ncbi:MAG: hypothetical protein PF574_01905 [Candidatus Delongbacteria bacterium]|jgi:Spy/CpxP family protein refolding chaperone|nr:hypothetical protein [Candidatus Delongbacteria bacterium]